MTQHDDQFLILTAGEILLILSNRAKPLGIGRDEIAKAFDVQPESVSRIYQYETLKEKHIQSACNLFGVPREIFDPGQTIAALFQRLNDLEKTVSENRKMIEELQEQKQNCETEKKGLLQLLNNKN